MDEKAKAFERFIRETYGPGWAIDTYSMSSDDINIDRQSGERTELMQFSASMVRKWTVKADEPEEQG